MPTTRESFLAQFSSGILPHVFEFGKRIAKTRADVFMLMARKAACFVDCLEELKLTEINGVVTTDRVLDMDTSWLRGKRVALIDDALISGTTLFRTEKELRNAGVSDLSLNVFCVNKDWWSNDLAKPDNPYLELNDQQTTSFCSDIVEALSVYPRPYAVDFPLFVNARIPLQGTDLLCTMSDWETFNLSSSLQRNHRIVSLTAIPSAALLEDFDRAVGWNLSDHCQLIKVRIYARLLDSARKTFWCRIMPIVAFDPLEPEQVEGLWKSATSFSFVPNKVLNSFKTLPSKLRLIQYLSAFRLGQIWLDQVKRELDVELNVEHDPRTLGLLFPPSLSGPIGRLCRVKQGLFEKRKVSPKEVAVPATFMRTRTKFRKNNLWSLQARLTEPFLEFYWSKEVKARRLAKKLGTKSFANKEYQDVMNRLRIGTSLPQLRSLLSDMQGSIDVRKLVSLYVDIANDRGIIVPVTAWYGGAVFRAYRHGEDVKFAEVEERLCCLMLSELAVSAGRKNLPHLWAEKMLVLLIRIGVHKQFLTRWSGTLGEEGSVGIRYALKGAVVESGSPKMYEYNPEGGLTALLLESGVLGKEKETGLYLVNDPPDAPTKEGADDQAIIIGSLFGELLKSDGKHNPTLTERELVLLATCLYPNDVAGALAAEISIFASSWKRRSQRIRNAALAGSLKKELEDLRAHVLYEAVTSGVWKFRSFVNNLPWQIVTRIGDGLQNQLYAATWRSFWPSTGSQSRKAIPSALKSLIKREGVLCLKANLLLGLLDVAAQYEALSNQHPAGPDKPREDPTHEPNRRAWANLMKSLDDLMPLCRELERLDKSGKLYSNVHAVHLKIKEASLDVEALKNHCLNQLDKLAIESRAILDIVDTLVTPFGQPRRLTRYAHAMYIELGQRGFVPYEYETRARKIIESNRILAKRTKEGRNQVARLDPIPQGQGDFHQGRWICATGAMGRYWLVRLAEALIKGLAEIEVRVTLMTNLAEDDQLLRAENTRLFRGKRFWNLANSVIKDQLPAWEGGVKCFVVGPSNKSIDQGIEAEMLNANLEMEITVPPIKLAASYWLKEYRSKNQVSRSLRASGRKADVGIITVITPEMRAVKDYLRGSPQFKQTKALRRSVSFYEGTVPASDGGVHRVVCTQQLERGNRSTVSAYDVLLKEYAPYLVVLLGVGGSIAAKVDIGDVVFADHVMYYDRRKETEVETVHYGEGYKIPAWLKPLLNDFFTDRNEPAEITQQGTLPYASFKIHRGALGSGEAVITDEASSQREWLKTVNDKTLVVETEAGGLVQAFYEGTLSFDDRAEGYFIVRGISDKADRDKTRDSQQIAAQNAMRALVEFLGAVPRIQEIFGVQ